MDFITRIKKYLNKPVSISPAFKKDLICFVRLRRRALRYKSIVVVEGNYNLVLVKSNRVFDVLPCGTYEVTEITIPRLYRYYRNYIKYTRRNRLTYIKTDAYYVNTNGFKLVKFKTPEKIIALKNKNRVKLRLEGTFSLEVFDSRRFMASLSKDFAIVRNKKAFNEISILVGFCVSKILNTNTFTVEEYLSNKEKIVAFLNIKVNELLRRYGFNANEFFIEKVCLPNNKGEYNRKVDKDFDLIKSLENQLNLVENKEINIIDDNKEKDYVFVEKNSVKSQDKEEKNIKKDTINDTDVFSNGTIENFNKKKENKIFYNSFNFYQNEPNLIMEKDDGNKNNILQNNKTKIVKENNINIVKENKPNAFKETEKEKDIFEDYKNIVIENVKENKTIKCICCGAKNDFNSKVCCVCKSKLD